MAASNNSGEVCSPLLTWEEQRTVLLMSALVGSLPFAVMLAFLYLALMERVLNMQISFREFGRMFNMKFGRNSCISRLTIVG